MTKPKAPRQSGVLSMNKLIRFLDDSMDEKMVLAMAVRTALSECMTEQEVTAGALDEEDDAYTHGFRMNAAGRLEMANKVIYRVNEVLNAYLPKPQEWRDLTVEPGEVRVADHIQVLNTEYCKAWEVNLNTKYAKVATYANDHVLLRAVEGT